MSEKILVVEDELSLSEALEYNLRQQGYGVITVRDGATAIRVARLEKPDLILLDIMLPQIDGIEVCRTLRPETMSPIIMLTALDDEIDRVVGLEVGADDYIAKPFSMRELMARVKAHLRRTRIFEEHMEESLQNASIRTVDIETRTFGDLVIDVDGRRVMCRGEWFHLKPMEFELLAFFAKNHGIALSRDQLLQKVWGWDYTAGSRTVDVHVRWLREKIEEDPAEPVRIVTVRGVGYRFDG
ncbi:MAG: response regulator transcription factor [Caldilineaceae bacterium]